MQQMLLFLSVIVVIFSGCEDKIATIKNQVMDFNNSITIGKAMDNWGVCSKKEWTT